MKKILYFLSFIFISIVAACAEGAVAETGTGAQWAKVAAFIGLALAAACGSIGQGMAVAKTVESIARQPEAGNQIRANMILGLAFIESLTIYTLLIALIYAFK
jgi:F-type H+-transporting ATPase subunit c